MSVEARNEHGEKIFKHFLEFTSDIQLMIIKELPLRDRFRFARCSKLSWDYWAKLTRNQPCLVFVHAYHSWIRLEIQHGKEMRVGEKDGFSLVFENRFDGSKLIRYKVNDSVELWNIEVDQSFDIIQIGVNHVQKALEFYQGGIKEMHINNYTGKMLLDFTKGIDDFKNLEDLEVTLDGDSLQSLLSKVPHPLKNLSVLSINGRTTLENRDQLLQVQEKLVWTSNDFNYRELLQLSAKCVKIDIGKLTEQDIANFMKSWENGAYNGRMETCRWDLLGSRFDRKLLCKLLQIDYSTFVSNQFRFVQEGSGKNAALFNCLDALKFMLM